MRLGVFGSRSALLGPQRSLRAPLACRAAPERHDGFIAASESGRPAVSGLEVQAQQVQQPPPQQQPEGPARRGRGRPPGYPAWNKGLPMPESTRKQLSKKLKQKWKDPEYRRSVTQAMLGRQTWNAGRPHDEETRAKMSEAKLGKPKTLATRKRMSASATARGPVGADARAEVSDRFRGQPKSVEHRSKLAAVARRRHAATRVLRAVEAVYAAASSAPVAAAGAGGSGGPGPVATAAAGGAGATASPTTVLSAAGASPAGSSAGLGAAVPAAGAGPGSASSGGGGGGGGGSSSSSGGGGSPNLGAVRAAAYSMGLTGLSDSKTGKRLSRSQILNTFKAELREYRALQEELSTWTAAFREKNDRKPNLVDVQRTGIPWLIERFKQYVVLRDRLFSDTSVLRGKLAEALPDPEAIRSANASSSSGLAAPNSVGALGPLNANGPGTGVRSAMASRFAAVMEYKMQKGRSAAAGSMAAAEQQQAGAEGAAGEEAGAAGVEQLASRVMTTPQAPPRVKLAMQAAMEYRQKKAQATKAAADAAAAAARSATSNSAAMRAARLATIQAGAAALPQGLSAAATAPVADDVPAPVAAVAASAAPVPTVPVPLGVTDSTALAEPSALQPAAAVSAQGAPGTSEPTVAVL